MNHKMRIQLTREMQEGAILESQSYKVTRCLWNWLFGRRRRVVILIPGDTVETVEVIEQPPYLAQGVAVS